MVSESHATTLINMIQRMNALSVRVFCEMSTALSKIYNKKHASMRITI